MNKILSLASLLMLAISFSSCTKTIEVSTPPEVNSISGSWYISDEAYFDNNKWYSYTPDLPGNFNFYDDGTAQYSDNAGTMQGNWYSNLITTGYYDNSGDFQANEHNDFSISVSGNGAYINLAFDDISFAGNNQFIATYYDGKSIQRYTFVRY